MRWKEISVLLMVILWAIEFIRNEKLYAIQYQLAKSYVGSGTGHLNLINGTKLGDQVVPC